MVEHKAPTQVTVHSSEGSKFAAWVERNWKYGAIAAVVATAAIIATQAARHRAHARVSERWDRFGSAAELVPGQVRYGGEPEAIAAAVEELEGSEVEPWARVALVRASIEARDYDAARAAIDELRAGGDPLLTQRTFPIGDAGGEATLVDQLEAQLARQEAWEEGRTGLFEPPAVPEDAPRVKLVTSAGEIVLGLYPEQAPLHVENFLKLCREGFYDGTKFHRVILGFMVQGGDPNTKEGDVSEWGQGGPGYKIDNEENDLYHYRGMLSMAKMGGDLQSSGSQFFLTTGAAHQLDGSYVVFGRVLEGTETLDVIEQGVIVEGTDRPVEPVVLESTEILGE